MKFSILIIYILFISCLNAVEQKVVSSLLNVKSMIEQHNKTNVIEAHVKKFEGETLAYVTPWNNRGM
ncbi:uncharacterized protein BX663DRAFT_522656 [Cokeromyces recurvatus]|uniref:uncharacterized protein n=1 Tax=Cokeromyces recurvatus TaxID=90255 RepID=UPI0022206E9C|nr:uncharacterized protein BX663DRAFT_522656 [Cokeromyces recurvatus]KAI7898961.1 hypothetical protein BX663DRAFT_522656 [Cokeromyces recurvatus]